MNFARRRGKAYGIPKLQADVDFFADSTGTVGVPGIDERVIRFCCGFECTAGCGICAAGAIRILLM